MLCQIELLENRIDFFEMVERFDGPGILHKSARLFNDGLASRQMRNRAQDVFPAIFDWKCLQQSFKTGLVFDVENIFERRNLFGREFHAINNSAEEVDATQIDLKSLDSQPLKRFNSDQQDLHVRSLSCAAVVFHTDLRELTLPAAFRFIEPQNLTRIKQADWFRR